MDRRTFMRTSLAGAAGLALAGAGQAAEGDKPRASGVRARDIRDHLLAMGPWVDPASTVDTFKSGDPEAVVTRVAVCWMNYTWVVRKALDLGCQMIVCHEPTYYEHWDRDPSVFDFEFARRKKTLIESSGIIILRCHDVWDRVEKIGIPYAWGEFLGFSRLVDKTTFCLAYEIDEVPAGTLARTVAGRVAALGQQAVELYGPSDKPVRRVVLGTGAITPFEEMVGKLKADAVICSDDGFTRWRHGTMAVDMGLPAIVVSHGVSEEPGVRRLAEHLAGAFPSLTVVPILQECVFQTIRA